MVAVRKAFLKIKLRLKRQIIKAMQRLFWSPSNGMFWSSERFICRVARTQQFSRLKAIAYEVASSFPAKNPSSALVRRILHKYKIKSYKRKRKPFVNLRQRCYRVQWSRILSHWTADQWKDVVFSDECRFGLKNDCRTLTV